MLSFLILGFASLPLTTTKGRPIEVQRPGSRVTVLFFITPDCPISRAFAPEMGRLAKEMGDRCRFYAVHEELTTTGAVADRWQSDYRFPFPALLDRRERFARSIGVAAVPTAAVFDRQGKLRYLGAIDDRFPDLGAQLPRPMHRPLRDALGQVLAGGPVKVPRTHVTGCALPRL